MPPDPPPLARLLTDHPAGDGEGLLFTEQKRLTKEEAVQAATRRARSFEDLGVSPGQAVAVQLDNGPELVTTMVGAWLAGAVFVPLNPRLSARERHQVLEALRPALLVSEDGQRSLRDPTGYDEDTAFVLWTSGTTGSPKPILQTHPGYLEFLDRVLGSLRSKPQEPSRRPAPNLIPVSLALNAGLYNALFGLRAGAALVIMDRFSTTSFATLVRRHDIRSTVLPPAAMVALNEDPAVVDLTPLAYVRSITAPLSPAHARRFSEKFSAFVLNGYGQAEIGEVIGWTAADAREHPEKLGAVGRAHRGVALSVRDDAGHELPTGSVGELWVRPPTLAQGYASGEGLEERLDAEGYLRTGDLARLDEDGFVWLEGRLGELINRGGNKVLPGEVEEVLRQAPGVKEAAVVGVPDDRLGQVPVAVVVPGAAGRLDEELLRSFCRAQLVPYKVPVRFVAADRLPRNEAGKLLRRQLVEQLAP